MMTDFRTLDAGEPLQHAVALVLAGAQRDCPVTENGRLAGVLTRDALVSALATGHADILVGHVMSREFQTADAHELLDVAFQRLQGHQYHVLPVLQRGQVGRVVDTGECRRVRHVPGRNRVTGETADTASRR